MAQSAAGGSRNIAAFEHVHNSGYYPPPSSIEYEGMYAKYQFETGEEKNLLFAPVFTAARSRDPISNKLETWLCVGMNSCLDGDGLKKHGGRPKLNLVLVVDISGSMNDRFDHKETQTKLAVAAESINSGLLPQLTADDRLAIVLFDTKADTLLGMKSYGDVDQLALKKQLSEMKTRGGTTLMAGLSAAEEQIKSIADWNSNARENRIFFMTDMCIDTHGGDGKNMFNSIERLSKERVYVTIVGLGVDFNTQMTQRIATIPACNWLAVKSTKEFKKMMNEQFDYLVTLVALDLKISIDAGSVKVDHVYGSPGHEATTSSDVLCYLSSSYPSLKDSPTLTQGGVMLLKLSEPLPTQPLKFSALYVDAKGGKHSENYSFTLPPAADTEFYQGAAVRKGLALTRYVSLMKAFLTDACAAKDEKSMHCSVSAATGTPAPAAQEKDARHYVTRRPLSPEYDNIFKMFTKYFEKEAEELGDRKMLDELKTLNEIIHEKKKDAPAHDA